MRAGLLTVGGTVGDVGSNIIRGILGAVWARFGRGLGWSWRLGRLGCWRCCGLLGGLPLGFALCAVLGLLARVVFGFEAQ